MKLPLLRAVAGLLFFLFAAAAVHAQSVEGVLSPGKVVAGHAKYEDDCEACHVRFDKAAQDRLCMDCHKEVGGDVRQKRGYHGRIKPEACKNCHTDHKGREAKIVVLDEKAFDHAKTDYALRDAHAKTQCADCHKPKAKWREAPSACVACHKKDDDAKGHKGSLGDKCADCHTEKNWKEAKFDHDKTDFALKGKHADAAVKCKDCHIDEKYKDTPKNCYACHKQDDDRKGHKGELGKKCETCHTEKNWKETPRFDHGKTGFPLKGKHADAAVKCKDCHKSERYKEAPKTCIGCHKKDDFEKKGGHNGRFGEKCESCHGEKDWKTLRFDHDKDTKYPLRDKHAKVKCDACHKGVLYKDKTPADCYACHRQDDEKKGHKGTLGKKCESCHNEKDWKDVLRFDHNRTRYPLVGKHVKVECKKCHTSLNYREAPRECNGCHEKEDVHKRRLGPQCESCHNARDWRIWDFDHDKTRYKLDGAHKKLDCLSCHKTPVAKKISLPLSCAGCHEQEDVHGGGFGKFCERCHVTGSWRSIRAGAAGSGFR